MVLLVTKRFSAPVKHKFSTRTKVNKFFPHLCNINSDSFFLLASFWWMSRLSPSLAKGVSDSTVPDVGLRVTRQWY